MNFLPPETVDAKPFMKWAGGKTQLLSEIKIALPKIFKEPKPIVYVEPFVGGGAIMFALLRAFPQIKKAVINDINEDLMNAYKVLKGYPQKLIKKLDKIQEDYYLLNNEEKKREFFLEKRASFNSKKMGIIENTSVLIFLNKTCFNGLYRVNSANQFNVPFGKYSRPKICDPKTIIADSKLLQKVEIVQGDFQQTLEHAQRPSFFYIDPPYKPISKTSSFNAYNQISFDDEEQIRLKNFCSELNKREHYWLLSNSDPQNTNKQRNFFEELYADTACTIKRIKAKRMINSKSEKRGAISELLMSNYFVD